VDSSHRGWYVAQILTNDVSVSCNVFLCAYVAHSQYLRLFILRLCTVSTGGFNRDTQIRFGLSAEEVGFLLHQLPDHQVEFSRKISTYTASTPGQIADELPDKVMRITPKEGGQFSLHVDFEKDGVGGQSTDVNAPALGPLEVTAQLGEWQVMQHLMQVSIPALVGWEMQMKIAMQTSVESALNSGGTSGPGPSAY